MAAKNPSVYEKQVSYESSFLEEFTLRMVLSQNIHTFPHFRRHLYEREKQEELLIYISSFNVLFIHSFIFWPSQRLVGS